jgi:dihydropteroate synthase
MNPLRPVDPAKVRVMGILNTTPDSFSDGGRWLDPHLAVRHAVSMVEAGADIIDIGGESTRPGAAAVSVQEEIDRVCQVVEAVVAETGALASIDTSKPEVMAAAVSAGAGMINDVFALRREGALDTAAALSVPVCLMHMKGQPRDMQQNPRYDDVVREVKSFLLDRVAACEEAGIAPSSIWIDPGFGFGKTLQHNIDLFRALPEFSATGYPVLVGVSRKSMLGSLTGRAVDDRMLPSVISAVLAAQSGAAVLRVHDVAETVEGLELAAQLTPLETAPVHNG